MGKLKSLKKHLIKWNRETFGFRNEAKRSLMDKIDEIDKKEEHGMMNSELIRQRHTRKDSLMDLILKEQRMFFQKCKLQWFHHGDENSNFFHKWMLARKSRTSISLLEDQNGILLTSEKEIEEEILNFFTKLYAKPSGQRFCGAHGMVPFTGSVGFLA